MQHLCILLPLLGAALPAAADDPAVVLGGLDPVELVAGREAKGRDAIAEDHGRLRYLFATEDNRLRFRADPGRFAAQNEGRCAVMPKVPGSPGLFLVHDGRIYLFGTPRCRERFEADPASFLKTDAEVVAVLLFDGVELLDFAGPGEVFSWAGRGRACRVVTVAATSRPIRSQGFVTVTPQFTFEDCPTPTILVVPGGSTREATADPRTIAWIRDAAKGADTVLSVCTGAFLLAKAGLLDGLEATTHRDAIEALRREAPACRVVADRRYVDNGKVVTSAGVSAGIDAALHIVERRLGREAADATARVLEYRRGPAEGAAP